MCRSWKYWTQRGNRREQENPRNSAEQTLESTPQASVAQCCFARIRASASTLGPSRLSSSYLPTVPTRRSGTRNGATAADCARKLGRDCITGYSGCLQLIRMARNVSADFRMPGLRVTLYASAPAEVRFLLPT